MVGLDSTTQHLIAGTTAGLVSTTLLYPLDVVKVRFQVHRASQRAYSSVWAGLVGIARAEGPFALYQGLVPALVGAGASWGGYFFFYEGIKERFVERGWVGADGRLGPHHHMAASLQAGAVLVMLTNPVWLVKTRLQLQVRRQLAGDLPVVAAGAGGGRGVPTQRLYTGMADALATIAREEGVRGLYKGVLPSLLLTSHGAVQFVVYEQLKAWVQLSDHAPTRTAQTLAMGAAAKVTAACATYPYQLVKTRVQQREAATTGTTTAGVATEGEWARAVRCVRETWRGEGPRGFFKGCWVNALRVAPAAAITFWCYEEVMRWLKLRRA